MALFWLASIAMLLFTVGCFDDDPTAPDPDAKQGEYRGSVSQNSVELTEQSPSAIISLKVRCFGQKLPDNCDANRPGWTNSKILPSYLSYSITDPSLPDTTATITVNWSAFAQFARRTSLASHTVILLGFVPTHKPEGLDLSGNTEVYVSLFVPAPAPENQPESAGTPHLTPIAPPLLEQFQSRKAGVVYKGPADSLNVSKGGLEPALFSVTFIAGNTPPFSVRDGDTVEVLVTYNGPADGQTHTATITFSSANPPPPPAPPVAATITLKGRQQPP